MPSLDAVTVSTVAAVLAEIEARGLDLLEVR
jgi:hypothetical protein